MALRLGSTPRPPWEATLVNDVMEKATKPPNHEPASEPSGPSQGARQCQRGGPGQAHTTALLPHRWR